MIIAESNIFYIHGLYGSRSSKKFKLIQEKYPNAICIEWKFNENIDFYLENTLQELKKVAGPISLIGSSAGGNLAWQIQQKLIEAGKTCELILINPLVELSYKYEDNFPQHLVKYLKSMNQFTNTKVILSLQDEVLNTKQAKTFFELYDYNNPNQIEIKLIDDDHRISHFNIILEEAN